MGLPADEQDGESRGMWADDEEEVTFRACHVTWSSEVQQLRRLGWENRANRTV
jgi:hypothetical protein